MTAPGPYLPDDADFREVFQNLIEGLVLCDLEGRVVHWNRSALAMHQVGDPAEVNRPLDELMRTFSLERLEGGPVPFEGWPVVRALRGDFVRELELRIRRSDREWTRVFSYSTSLAPGREGRPALIVVHMSDVTARHEAEQANAESLLGRQLLVDASRLLLLAPRLDSSVLRSVFELIGGRAGFEVCAYDRPGCACVTGALEQFPLQLPAGLWPLTAPVRDRRDRELGSLTFGVRREPTAPQIYLAQTLANQLAMLIERESALAEGRAQLSSLSESLQQLVWMTGPDGRTDYLAARWETYAGVPIPQLLTDGWASLVHPDDLPAARAMWTGKRPAERPLQAELRIRRHDGVYRWFSIEAVPLRAASGEVERWFGLNTEIEELRQTQRSLRDREQRLQLVFDQVSAIIWTLDRDLRVTSVSGQAVASFGFVPEKLIGRSVFELLPPGVKPEGSFAEFSQRALTGEVQHYDTQVGERFFHSTVAPLRENDGTIIGVIGLALDVTEQRHAQAVVQRLNAELETRVADATAELRAANAELEAFAYAVSHDLRAPLRAMSGFSEAILEDLGPQALPEVRSSAQRIVKASRTMGTLIDALLKLSRHTRADLQFEHVDVSALAEAINATLVGQSPQRQLRCHVEPRLIVRGDRTMLAVLFQNLLENAWKYTSKTPTPEVWVETQVREGHRYVCVRDNGAGFDMAYAARLFAPFQRLHRQDEFPGLGVGLATVQRIVHRHGGRVFAEGKPNLGAVIGFWLPDEVRTAGDTT